VTEFDRRIAIADRGEGEWVVRFPDGVRIIVDTRRPRVSLVPAGNGDPVVADGLADQLRDAMGGLERFLRTGAASRGLQVVGWKTVFDLADTLRLIDLDDGRGGVSSP
jgi:hypothetical protein